MLLMILKIEKYTNNIRLIGLMALLVGVAAWVLDLTGLVYECPYCRTQRTVIALLGIILMLPNPRHWLLRYIATSVAFLGAHVAAAQHFAGWRKISGGTFSFSDQIYIDPFLLSGCALFMIVGLASLLFVSQPSDDTQ
ncbi:MULTISPECIES: disulfide bond formation protein B [Kordiimonas]|uniref:disulfide bond formation protein B n=1 Tax=Kordiimonas TaxID=288021 RepID=UPI00257AF8F4|nr:disulfide bond formation protein B [Kordiimonas sp. UBA4487]